MVSAWYCVCVYSLALSKWTAAHQPAEPMQGRGVCWGPSVSKVRADMLSWNEIDAGESFSCFSGTQIFSEEEKRLLEQETQSDRTWKPTAAMTHDGHKRCKRRRLPLPFPHHTSPSLLLHRPLYKEGKGKGRADAWIPAAPSWTLAPFNAWSLMFHVEFTEMGSFKDNLIGQS